MPEFFTSELLMPHIKEFTSANKDIDLNIEGLGVEQEMNSDADITVVLTRKIPKARKVARLFPIRYVPVCNQTKIDQDQTGDQNARMYSIIQPYCSTRPGHMLGNIGRKTLA